MSLGILEPAFSAGARHWSGQPRTGAASVAANSARRKRALGALLLLLCLGGCTDLRVVQRVADPAAHLESHGAFVFVREPLAGNARASAAALAMDQAVRAAIAAGLQASGYAPARPGDTRLLRVDYTVSNTGGVNARRLDSPSDYARSWHGGGTDDGTGSMDHTVADVAFYRDLSLTVLLFPSTTGTLAWEGTARQSFPGDLPQGARLQAAVDRMILKLLRPLPRAR